jgi:hypothetical protein
MRTLGVNENHLLSAALLAVDEANPLVRQRIRCHLLQGEAYELLVTATHATPDKDGVRHVEPNFPSMVREQIVGRLEGNYTFESHEEGKKTILIARGHGEMDGDVWTRTLPNTENWWDNVFAPIDLVRDACAGAQTASAPNAAAPSKADATGVDLMP